MFHVKYAMSRLCLLFNLIRHFSTRSTLYVLACTCLALSRLFQVLSFFVPLKVLILVGSKSVPSYFSLLEGVVEYELLIQILLLSVPFFYISYMVLGVAYRNLIDKDYKVFKDSEFIAKEKVIKGRGYSRLHGHASKALSEFMIIIGGVIVVFFMDYYLAISMFVLLVLLLLLFSLKVLGEHDDVRLTWLKLHKKQYIEYFSSGCFVLFFGFIVVKAYYGEAGVFELIFALLFSRQIFQALQRMSFEYMHVAKILG